MKKGPERSCDQIWIELRPVQKRKRICSGCGEEVKRVHDTTERWVRDLPILDAETWLLVHRVRVLCPRCGPKVESLDWLEKYARVTKRFAENVARLCMVLPIKHVAEYFGLSWDSVKKIDKASLKERLGLVDLSNVEMITMDEFAIHKGQRYATVIVNAATKQVLWVCSGHGREAVRPFFEALGGRAARKLTHLPVRN